MYTGYFKEMMYILHNRGVKISNVIMEILNESEKYPIISEKLERIKKCNMENLFDSEEEVCKYFSSLYSDESKGNEYIGFKDPHILSLITMGEMIRPPKQNMVINEVFRAAMVVFKRVGMGNPLEFSKELEFAKVLVQNIILPFWAIPNEIITVDSPYDLKSWTNKNYNGILSEYLLEGKEKYKYEINNLNAYIEFVEEKAGLPFYLQAEFFYRTFRSNNLRRFISQ
jgi:hypothetical protein